MRKSEFDAIQKILLEDGIEASPEGVRAIAKAAIQAILERDWYLVHNPTNRLTYGLFATEGAATKAATANEVGVFGTVGVVKILSAEQRLEYVKVN